MSKTMTDIQERLEYLRGEAEEGRLSYGEIAELQGLADHIDLGDVNLLQWAGVPEFHWSDEDEDPEDTLCSEVKCYQCRLRDAA